MNQLEVVNKNYLEKESYVVSFTNTLSKTTKETYSSDIKSFFGVKNFEDITVEMICSVGINDAINWRNSLIKRGLKDATINKKLAALESFYKFLTKRSVGIAEFNPFEAKEGCTRIKGAISSYSGKTDIEIEDVKKMIEAIPQDSKEEIDKLINTRNYLIVTLLLTTGIRRDELTNIKLGDIEVIEGKKIVTIHGKGNKIRKLVIPDHVMDTIELYVSIRGIKMYNKDEYLITSHTKKEGIKKNGLKLSDTSVNIIIKKIAKDAGLEDKNITPHSFRHTFCTQSLKTEGVKIEDVQDQMGHSNVSTTRRYDHINRTLENSTTNAIANKFNI